MDRKVHKFKEFVLNEYEKQIDSTTNESMFDLFGKNKGDKEGKSFSLGSFLKAKIVKLGEYGKSLIQSLQQKVTVDNKERTIISIIPDGSKKGLTDAVYFGADAGSIVDQMKSWYRGTKYEEENPASIYEGETKNYDSVTDLDQEIDEATVPLEWPEDDKTVRDVSAEELKDKIRKAYRKRLRGGPLNKGASKSIFIYGAPGIGKTEIVAQIADEFKCDLSSFDLRYIEPVDFLGVPRVELQQKAMYDESGKLIKASDGKTVTNRAGLLPDNNGKNGNGGILFFDEMNRAGKIITNSLMQFVQLGKIGNDYTLPDKWIIIAAGNRPAEAETIEKMDYAEARRFRVLNLVPRVDDWVQWAKDEGIFQPEFIRFIEEFPIWFHYLDVDKDVVVYPNPASWTDAAVTLNDEMEDEGVNSWRDLPLEQVLDIYRETVGPDATSELRAYLEVLKKLTEKDLKDIVHDPMHAKMLNREPGFMSTIFGVMEMALREYERATGDKMEPKLLLNMMKYFGRYGDLEKLTWFYKRIQEKYKDFAINQDVLNNPEEGDNPIKIEAAVMVRKKAKDKNLI